MDRRRAGLAGIALLALAAAYWLTRPSPPAPRAAESGRAVGARPARPAPVRSSGPSPEEEAPFEPSSPVEEALHEVAAIAGEGMIRCAAGPLPPGPLDAPGLGFAVVRDGRLSATVVQPTGALEIGDPVSDPFDFAPPIATVSWAGAFPGAVATCEVRAAEEVEVRGVVVSADGRRLAGHGVRGCGDEVVSDDDGRFTLLATRGVPCSIHARPPGLRSGYGIGVDLVPEPGIEVTVELTAPLEVQPDALALLDAFASAPVEEHAVDAFRIALEESDLSSEARSVLESWIATRDAGIEDNRQLREELEAREDLADPDAPKELGPPPGRGEPGP